jgi:hypothetical protein
MRLEPRSTLILVLVLIGLAAGCATLKEVAALRHVDFHIDHVSDMNLAGIDLTRVHSYQDLGYLDVAKLGVVVATGELPLEFLLHVRADNPASNPVAARLVKMEWMLFLRDRQTISGVFDENLVIPPGEPTDVPIVIQLDLLEFFDESAKDLVDLALAVAGWGDTPRDISLRVTPTIDTPLGPIRYPEPITVVSH